MHTAPITPPDEFFIKCKIIINVTNIIYYLCCSRSEKKVDENAFTKNNVY